MSWRDAQGLEEQYGCCGRKLFYCSKLVLLNDGDDDKEETFGEYVPSTKQLKKIRRQVEMPKNKDPIVMTMETFSPWYWWIILGLISLWLHRCSSVTHPSNYGAWLNSFIIHFPLITYHSHNESQVLSYCHPFLLLHMTPFPVLHHHISHGCLSCLQLTEAVHHDSFLTHFWLTLFSMLVEYSGNDIIITLSA